MSDSRFIGLVVPCFNEEKRINYAYWQEIIRDTPNVSWLFVNDGSTDQTLTELHKLEVYEQAEVISLAQNSGKAEAIREGFNYIFRTKPQCTQVGFLDVDGAFSKYDIVKFSEISTKILFEQGFDALFSSRVALSGREINRKLTRHYLGRIIATYICRSFSGLPYDTQSGFKIYRKSNALEQAISEKFTTRWFLEIELIARQNRFQSSICKIWEEPISYWSEVDGSKLKLKSCLAILIDIILARKLLKKSYKTLDRITDDQ